VTRMSGFDVDPVCPFAWLASKWARMVQAQRDHTAGWRFISLQMINRPWTTTAVSRQDTRRSRRRAEAAARRRPDQYRARPRRGRPAVGGHRRPPVRHRQRFRPCRWRIPRHPHLSGPVLAQAGLPAELADALEDTSSDAGIRQETGEALALPGKDAGTPIIPSQPPASVGFLRPGDQPPARRRRGCGAAGHHAGPGQLPGLRRAQSQRARATATCQLRCGTRPGRRRGGLERRQPSRPGMALGASAPPSRAAGRNCQLTEPDCRSVNRIPGVKAGQTLLTEAAALLDTAADDARSLRRRLRPTGSEWCRTAPGGIPLICPALCAAS
jgi:hypothetical protein